MPTARAKTMTKASERRPWKVRGSARDTGTDRWARGLRRGDRGAVARATPESSAAESAASPVPGPTAGLLPGAAMTAAMPFFRFRPRATLPLHRGVSRGTCRIARSRICEPTRNGCGPSLGVHATSPPRRPTRHLPNRAVADLRAHAERLRSVGRRSPYLSANAYPAPRTVRTNRGLDGSSSSFSRRWLTWTLIVFSSWSSAS